MKKNKEIVALFNSIQENMMSKSVEIRSDGATTTSNHKNTIGWFANRYNRAAGWIVTELTSSDTDWLESKNVKNISTIKRTYSDKGNTSLVRFNLKTGTYAFVDNKYLEDHDIVKFERMSKFSIFMLDDKSHYF